MTQEQREAMATTVKAILGGRDMPVLAVEMFDAGLRCGAAFAVPESVGGRSGQKRAHAFMTKERDPGLAADDLQAQFQQFLIERAVRPDPPVKTA